MRRPRTTTAVLVKVGAVSAMTALVLASAPATASAATPTALTFSFPASATSQYLGVLAFAEVGDQECGVTTVITKGEQLLPRPRVTLDKDDLNSALEAAGYAEIALETIESRFGYREVIYEDLPALLGDPDPGTYRLAFTATVTCTHDDGSPGHTRSRTVKFTRTLVVTG